MDDIQSWSGLLEGAVRYEDVPGANEAAERAGRALAHLLQRRVAGRPHGDLPVQRPLPMLEAVDRSESDRQAWELAMDVYSPPLLFRTHCDMPGGATADGSIKAPSATRCPDHIAKMVEEAVAGTGPAPVHRMVVTSCDRYIEDHDEGLWLELLTAMPELDAAALPRRERTPTDGDSAGTDSSASRAGVPLWSTAFMEGDNVYMDFAAAFLLAQPKPMKAHEMRSIYRQMYRASYSRPLMRRFMRRGAHVMVGDDHEAVNNLARWMMRAGPDHPRDGKGMLQGLSVSHHAGNAVGLRDVVRAAQEVFVEYQLALTSPRRAAEWLAARRGGGSTKPVVIDIGHSVLTEAETGSVMLPIGDVALAEQLKGSETPELDELAVVATVNGPSSHFSLWLGSTVVLQIDTRWQRSFLPDPLSPFLGRQQLAHAASVLAKAEQSGKVRDIVIPSSVPLLWMGYHEADVALHFENDEYAALRNNIPGTAALLELVSASSKVSYIVGGDVHCASRNAVCRTDWEELRAALAASKTVEANGSVSASVDAGLKDVDVLPGDSDAGNVLAALQRVIVSAVTSARVPIVDGRSRQLQSFVLLADAMGTRSFWSDTEAHAASMCSRCLRGAVQELLSSGVPEDTSAGNWATDSFFQDDRASLSASLYTAMREIRMRGKGNKRWVAAKLSAHACLRAFVVGQPHPSAIGALAAVSLPETSRCVGQMVSSGSSTKSTSLTGLAIIAFNSLLQHGGPVRVGPWEAEGSFHPAVNTLTLEFEPYAPNTADAQVRGAGPAILSGSGVQVGREARVRVSADVLVGDGTWARREEAAARFVSLDWYEEQHAMAGSATTQQRQFGPDAGEGGYVRVLRALATAAREFFAGGMLHGDWAFSIDPRDSLTKHGGSTRPEARALFEELSCTSLVPVERGAEGSTGTTVAEVPVAAGSSVEVGTAGNLSALLAVSSYAPATDPAMQRVWCECGATATGGLQYAACHRATSTARFALVRLLQVRGDLVVLAIGGLLGSIALTAWAAVALAQTCRESCLIVLLGGPIAVAWKLAVDSHAVLNAAIGGMVMWAAWVLIGTVIVALVPTSWFAFLGVYTPWADLVLLRFAFGAFAAATGLLMAVMIALELARSPPDVGSTATVVFIAAVGRMLVWIHSSGVMPVQGTVPTP